jgi:hypothetical protein
MIGIVQKDGYDWPPEASRIRNILAATMFTRQLNCRSLPAGAA